MEGVAAGVINPLAIHCETVRLKSEHPTQFIDLTAWVERAVRRVLEQGHRTRDIAEPSGQTVGTREMGDLIVGALEASD